MVGSLVTRVSIDASKTRAKIKQRVGRARGRFEFHSTRRLRSRGARNGHNKLPFTSNELYLFGSVDAHPTANPFAFLIQAFHDYYCYECVELYRECITNSDIKLVDNTQDATYN